MAQILLAKDFDGELKERIRAANAIQPRKLIIVTSGDDPASKVYVRNKLRLAEELGIECEEFHYSKHLDKAHLTYLIMQCHTRIIIQQPYDRRFEDDLRELQSMIAPHCDVDGINDDSLYTPATARGVMEFLKNYRLAGKTVCIVGRSKLVGHPLIDLCLAQNATVISANSYTEDLASLTSIADVVISAVGYPHLITADMIKEGAICIDVGISFVNGEQVGDFDFEACKEKALAITPTKGACGKMTVVELMANVVGI